MSCPGSPDAAPLPVRGNENPTIAGSEPVAAPTPASEASRVATHGDGTPTVGGNAPTPAPLPNEVVEGRAFGRYRLLTAVGEGGMGVVWKAWDTDLRRIVALKKILPHATGGKETLERFLREARLAAKLRHPNIVAIYDVGTVDGEPFLTMEYVQGRTFASALSETRDAKQAGTRQGAARLREEIRTLAEVAEAVAYAHREGIIHRDLKPSNVLLDGAGHAFVMDFGLAKEVAGEGPATDGTPAADRPSTHRERTLTLSGQVLGTPAYMSPEQADCDAARIGPRSDVWALGVMLYELLTGRFPFGAEPVLKVLWNVLHQEPVRPRAAYGPSPEELEAICLKAIEKEPDRRYATAGEFAAELQRWLRGEPVQARSPSTVTRIWRRMVRRRAVVLPIAAAVALAVLALGWAGHERGRGATRTRQMLARITPLVARLEDAVMRKAMDAETRALVAEQPLGMLHQLIQDEPGYGPAFAWRGKVHDLLGRGEEAAADFERGCALAPEDAATRLLRGMHRIDRWVRARGLPPAKVGAHGVEFLDPGAPTPEEAAWRDGGLDDLARLDAATSGGDADDPDLARDVRIARALAALYGGRREDHEGALAAVEGTRHPRAERIRGLALYHLRRFDEAVEAFDRALADWSRDPRAWAFSADAAQASGLAAEIRGEDPRPRFRDSARRYDEALARDSGAIALLFSRSGCLQRLGDAEAVRAGNPDEPYRRALADLDAYLKQRPGYVPARNNRGCVWWSMARWAAESGRDPRADFARALADLEEAHRLLPGFPDALLNRGSVYNSLGEAETLLGTDPRDSFRRAIACHTEALAAFPDVVQGYNHRGNARMRLAEAEDRRGGDPLEGLTAAIADFDETLRRDPEFALTYNNRGNARMRLADRLEERGEDGREGFRRALEDLDEAVRRQPKLGDSFNNRGLAWHRLAVAESAHGGDPRESRRKALADYDTALANHAGHLEAWNGRGVVKLYLAFGARDRGEDPTAHLRDAEADFTRVLSLHPRHADALANRALVRQSLAKLQERAGGDPRPCLRESLADVDASLAIAPASGVAHATRADTLWDLAKADDGAGLDPEPRLREAEAAYRMGLASGHPASAINLGVLLRNDGRYREALEVLDACASARHGRAKDAADQQEATRALLRMGASTWVLDLGRAVAALERGSLAEARKRFERVLRLIEGMLAALPPAEAQALRSAAATGDACATAHYGLACAHAADASGGATARDRAVDHLEAALRHGYDDTLEPLDEDPRLARLEGHGRFDALVAARR